MKKLVWNLVSGFMAVAVIFLAASCEKDNDRNGTSYEDLYKPIIKNYVETTIYPTYENLAKAALVMRKANNALQEENGLTDANIKAAADAWMATRIYWELSEAFLFGPISENGYDVDGHIDSWPLEVDEIEDEIEEIRKENKKLSAQEVWKVYDAEVIGFHVTEYLLFRNGDPRKAAEIDAAELNYLTAVTDALVWDCVLAYVAWRGEEKVSADILEVFKENQDVIDRLYEKPTYMNFGDKFMNNSSSAYFSWRDIVSEIASGAIDIADEVGTTKILEPYDEGNVFKVESWYSWHSLDDYQNNILSIKNAYLGGMDNNSRTNPSLSTYIASVNAKLDAEIKEQIQDCIDKIKAIGGGSLSFYEVVEGQLNRNQVEAAAEACGDLAELFEQVKKNLE